jgi:hypothetical protein
LGPLAAQHITICRCQTTSTTSDHRPRCQWPDDAPAVARTRSPRHRFNSLTSVSLRAPSPACANASVSSGRSCIGRSSRVSACALHSAHLPLHSGSRLPFRRAIFPDVELLFFGTKPPLGLSPVLIVLDDWLTLTLFRRICRDSMILKSLIAGRPFLYQSKEGTVYHVAQNGVEAIRSSWSAETHIGLQVCRRRQGGLQTQIRPPRSLSADYCGIIPKRRISMMDKANR